MVSKQRKEPDRYEGHWHEAEATPFASAPQLLPCTPSPGRGTTDGSIPAVAEQLPAHQITQQPPEHLGEHRAGPAQPAHPTQRLKYKRKEPYRARELSWFIFNSLEIYRTFPSHLHRREKNRLAWRELFKAVTEPFLSITLLNRHPNGTAEMITGEVQWNCWNSSAQNQSLG